MEKIIILVVAIGVLSGVNSLQCYKCTNCNEVKSDQLVTCGANTTATTTTTTQSPNTTTSTTVSTTTTVTTAKPTNNTTNGTTSTTSTTTTPNNTTSSSTTSSSTTSSTTTSTTTTSTTTTSPVTAPSNVTTNSTSNVMQENPDSIRVRRSADEEYEDNCFCNNNGECNCHGLRIIEFRDVYEKATESYVCVTDTVHVNGSAVINRGCAVKHNQTQQTCIGSAFSTNCTVCETDLCNDAAAMNLSIVALVTSFFAVVKLV